jgi:predicted metalloprotease with PDZ domain
MKISITHLHFQILTATGILSAAASACAQNTPIALNVDASDAPRMILHARLVIPAAPGKLTLVYPKWIPGEHAPTGPVTDLVGLKLTAGGKSLNWQRDAEDMFAFHLEVPPGADRVEAALDFLLPPDSEGFSSAASATAQLVAINWNQVLLYPKGTQAGDLKFAASLRLPAGWKHGTALPLAQESASGLEFSPVSLETLVDSPLIAGANFRTFDLTPGANPSHQIHVVADSAAALEMKREDVACFSRLTAETSALFGARHYRGYHFLLTLSDNVAHFGLEHHESSDNRAPERMLIDEDLRKLWASLMPHEMVHSWNGKHRRPAELITPDYQQPMKTELLWVYEGLTTYLGELLAVRSGLWTNGNYHEYLAGIAAKLDHQAGRTWRPLVDTTVAAQLLYTARLGGASWRRSVDFYPEGLLIWLEADVTIRQQTEGRRSLDDFCRKFFGGVSGPPNVIAYNFDDVVKALNEIAPFDWREFFVSRVNTVTPRAPLGGIEGSGWRVVYNDALPDMLKATESAEKLTDLSFSLGIVLKEDGTINDVIPGMAADKAGVGPGMKLIAVNGRRWTPAILRTAVKTAKAGPEAIELLVENGDFFKTCKLDYHEGEKYPHLERNAANPDLLGQILKPLAAHTTAN